MVKIIDCVLFYNEIDMLLFRMKELSHVVDYFIICEATHTFVGNVKSLIFADNRDLFAEYKDQIIHVVVDDLPNNGNPWDNEFHQRRAGARGLELLPTPLDGEDLILISDVDEIPSSRVLEQIKGGEIVIRDIEILSLTVYYYNFNCRSGVAWYDLKIVRYDYFNDPRHGAGDMQRLRKLYRIPVSRGRGAAATRSRSMRMIGVIHNAGWHLSYFGDIEFIRNKILNISHQELNKPENLDPETIRERIKTCQDLFGRDNNTTHKFAWTEIDPSNLPKYWTLLRWGTTCPPKPPP